MKLSIIALLFATFLSSGSVLAEGDHSEDVCSVKNTSVCAHLGHMTKVNSSDEVKFIAHIMAPKNTQVTNFKLDLWMPSMGHGSSPVTITQVGVNKYQISEAYFIMNGSWEVRVTFDFDGATHNLSFPVQVN